jgi:hypothetical protein
MVEIHHEVPTGEHRLCDRDHDLAGRQTPAALVQLADTGVQGSGDPEHAIELVDETKTGTRAKGSVRRTKRDSGSGAAYRVHLTGAFLPGS